MFCYNIGSENLQAWEISYSNSGWAGYQIIIILAEDEEKFIDILYNELLLNDNNNDSYIKDMREARKSSEYGGSSAWWKKKYCTDPKLIDILINSFFDGNAHNAKTGVYKLPFNSLSFGSDHLWD